MSTNETDTSPVARHVGATIGTLKDELQSTEYEVDDLETALDYEKDHEDREGAKDALNAAIEAVESVPSGEEEESGNESDTDESEAGATDEADGDVEPSPEEDDAPEQVTISPVGRLSVAGHVFEAVSEEREVAYTERIRQAAERGTLSIEDAE